MGDCFCSLSNMSVNNVNIVKFQRYLYLNIQAFNLIWIDYFIVPHFQTRETWGFIRETRKTEIVTVDHNFMFPLYQLGFTLLWNSYRIGALFPIKMNNSAAFLCWIAFTLQRFSRRYKIYRISLHNGMETCQSVMETVLIFTCKSRKHIQSS